LQENNLNGTIPPELGNLNQLAYLYADSPSLTISALYDDPSSIDFTLSRSVICSLSLSQVPDLESAHWHRPSSTRQPLSAVSLVRSESHRLIFDNVFPLIVHPFWILLTMPCIKSRYSCSLRQLSSNQLTGTIPPRLGNLTQLQVLYDEIRIVLVIFAMTHISYVTLNHWLFSLAYCCSPRALGWNQITGSIPRQLGDIPKLRTLYAQHRIDFLDAVLLSLMIHLH